MILNAICERKFTEITATGCIEHEEVRIRDMNGIFVDIFELFCVFKHG